MRQRLIEFRFLSTLSLRRATLNLPSKPIDKNISIHALLAESDNRYGRPIDVQLVFLSTLSLRRATAVQHPKINKLNDFYPRSPCGERLNGLRHKCASLYFYPRSPCGERHTGQKRLRQKLAISIHALLAESDPGRAPLSRVAGISIHALLAESDS